MICMAESTISKLQPDLDAILGKLKKAGNDYVEGLSTAVYTEALRIMRTSLRQVPVDFGILRSSAYVSLPRGLRDVSLRMGYGTDYGIYVHEDAKARHNPPTKYHFLSDPIKDALPGMLNRLAKTAQNAVKTGRFVTVPLMAEKPLVGKVKNKVEVSTSTRKRKKKVTRKPTTVTGKKRKTTKRKATKRK